MLFTCCFKCVDVWTHLTAFFCLVFSSELRVCVGDCVCWGENELNIIVIKKLTKKHHGYQGFGLGIILKRKDILLFSDDSVN